MSAPLQPKHFSNSSELEPSTPSSAPISMKVPGTVAPPAAATSVGSSARSSAKPDPLNVSTQSMRPSSSAMCWSSTSAAGRERSAIGPSVTGIGARARAHASRRTQRSCIRRQSPRLCTEVSSQ
eukprot:scaffold12204_cov61-Phaeocystis_antarctica.AAC.16